jgi:hypothetical protein
LRQQTAFKSLVSPLKELKDDSSALGAGLFDPHPSRQQQSRVTL